MKPFQYNIHFQLNQNIHIQSKDGGRKIAMPVLRGTFNN